MDNEFHFVAFAKIIQGLAPGNSQFDEEKDQHIRIKLLNSSKSLLDSLQNGDFEQQRKYFEFLQVLISFFVSITDSYRDEVKIHLPNENHLRIAIKDFEHWCRIVTHLVEWICSESLDKPVKMLFKSQIETALFNMAFHVPNEVLFREKIIRLLMPYFENSNLFEIIKQRIRLAFQSNETDFPYFKYFDCDFDAICQSLIPKKTANIVLQPVCDYSYLINVEDTSMLLPVELKAYQVIHGIALDYNDIDQELLALLMEYPRKFDLCLSEYIGRFSLDVIYKQFSLFLNDEFFSQPDILEQNRTIILEIVNNGMMRGQLAEFNFTVLYLRCGVVNDFGLQLLLLLFDGIKLQDTIRPLSIYSMSQISRDILLNYFSKYASILYSYVFEKFISSDNLLSIVARFVSNQIQQFVDDSMYFVFPKIFFTNSPLLDNFIQLKGIDSSTFFITNIHYLISYSFVTCDSSEQFNNYISRALERVGELSGNSISFQDILKACSQDVLKVLFLELARSCDPQIRTKIEESLRIASRAILDEPDDKVDSLSHLLKKRYLGIFYSLHDDLKASACHYEQLLLTKTLFEITKLLTLDDMKAFSSHIIPFLEDSTVKFGQIPEFNTIFCGFWECLMPAINHDLLIELLFFVLHCNEGLFKRCQKEYQSAWEVQVLFGNNFVHPTNQIFALLASFLSSKYEFIIEHILNVFCLFLADETTRIKMKSSVESSILSTTVKSLFQLASNPKLETKCMKVLSLFNVAEEFSEDALNHHAKPNSYFLIDYLDTRNAILDASSTIIEEFLIPSFRSCRDFQLQDRLAYVIQELLKITGFSQLIVSAKQGQPTDSSTLNGYESFLLERWKKFPQVIKDNLFPLLRAKYVVNLPNIQTRNPSHLLRTGAFSIKEWIYTFFFNVMTKISSDFLVEFFSPFKAIINNDVKLMNYILSCVILCSTMDPVEYDVNAEYIVTEFNAVFRHFSSNVAVQSNTNFHKLIEAIFSIIDCLKCWMQRIMNSSFKTKKPVSNGNILALRRMEEIFFAKIDKFAAASCALTLKRYSTALLFLESNCLPVSSNNDFIASQYPNLKVIYSNLGGKSNLKELVKHYHEDNMDLRIIFEMEKDWRNCLLLNQHNSANQLEIDKCLYMLGMDEIVVQKYSSSSTDVNEYVARAIINLQRWDLLETHQGGNNSLAIVSHILNDTLTLEKLYILDDFEQTCLNTSIFYDIGRNVSELQQQRLSVLHFDPYDKLFGFHLLIDKFSSSNLWLERAKFCRKNRLFDLSYASLLKIPNHLASCEVVMERAKIMWHQGYRIQALQELKNSQEHIKFNYHPSTATANASSSDCLKGKILRLTAKWMDELKMDMSGEVLKKIREAIYLDEHSEKGHYMFAKYHFKLYLNHLEKSQGKDEAARFLVVANNALNIVRCFARALLTGSKFVYESMPRMLNVWLDVTGKCFAMYEKGPSDPTLVETMSKMEKSIEKLIGKLAPWQFYVGINLLIARFNHACPVSSDLLQRIIITLLQHYPDQTMWFLFSQARSSNAVRKNKFYNLLAKLKNTSSTLKFDQQFMTRFNQCLSLFESLLQISNYSPSDKQISSFTLSSIKEFKYLNQRMFPLNWIVPQTDSLILQLPLDNSHNLAHNPFPLLDSYSGITGIKDTVEVLNSLQRPKKIALLGSDGREYEFLCKPKDDLRTDARVMEFFSLINKLIRKDKTIKSNNELNAISIRCYCVLPLNEECGIIEWVPSTICYRTAVNNTYSIKGVVLPPREELVKLFELKMPQSDMFVQKLLPRYPSVFADWFRFQFVDAMHWYSAKQHYARSTATMSMVGAMLGLGDRHGENIMLDELTGSVVHVDFNCLFDKGLKFAKPEKVPFRMTHNMEHAFGILGTKGLFREACIAVLRIMRNNHDMLLSNLETFVHDPIIDFSKKKPSSSVSMAGGTGRAPEVEEAVRCITAVGTRLMGYVGDDLPLSVEGQVEELIKNATDINNLSQMFIGWAAFL